MLRNIVLMCTFTLLSVSALATEISGKIQSISQQAKVIQLINPKTKAVTVLKYTEQTKLIDADSFNELTVNTKLKAIVDQGLVAHSIRRILVTLPVEQVIDTDELADLLDEGATLFIGDARPKGKYNMGHIPTAKSTPANRLADNLAWLPEDKSTPLVFYCGGVTCPLSPKALTIAKQHGYTDVRAYVEGNPAWKRDVYPIHVNASWLANHLDKHHIILDVRSNPTTFIQGAVHMPVSQLAAMHTQWNQEKYPTSKRTFLALRDKKAPIAVIADSDDSEEAVEAYEYLAFWKFKNVAILAGGMENWLASNLPTSKGTIATQLSYEKKQVKGAIAEAMFVKAVDQPNTIIIDVRSPDEFASGHLKGARNIPLEELDQQVARIPKKGQVIIHCLTGSRAALAYMTLTNKGYRNIVYLDDAFLEVVKTHGITLI